MKKTILVETLSSFIHQYVIEIDDDFDVQELSKYEEDLESYGIEEFNQKHIGTKIISTREITEKQYDVLYHDAAYINDDHKSEFINKIEPSIFLDEDFED